MKNNLMVYSLVALAALTPSLLSAAEGQSLRICQPKDQAENREALLIANQAYTVLEGNQEYKKGVLRRPIQDVQAVADALCSTGFNVTVHWDVANYEAFRKAMEGFVDRIRDKNAVAYFYYSGHGVGLELPPGGADAYMVPVRLMKPTSDRHLGSQSYPLGSVVRELKNAGSRLQLVVMDACRDNPFLEGVGKKDTEYLVAKGLPRRAPESLELKGLRVESTMPAQGTAMFYPVPDGQSTPDDGVYAAAWVQVLRTPGMSLGQLHEALAVGSAAKGGSVPDTLSRYVGTFRFSQEPVPPAPVPVMPVPPAPVARPTVVARILDHYEGLGGKWIDFEAITFNMGSNSGDPDEKPVHSVSLSPYRLSKSEVTVAQYQACVQAGVCTEPASGEYCNWDVKGREQHPVNCVDWNQATAFARWVGARLPTEAEWEAAARGKEGRKYPWGNSPEPDCERAVFFMNGSSGCGLRSTAPVCSRALGNTPEGLCDMTGNVCEWTLDWYGSKYYALKNFENPVGPDSGSDRVLRGGSWAVNTDWLRVSDRIGYNPSFRFNGVGFRLASMP